MATETATIADQILNPATGGNVQYDFTFNDYLKREFRFGVGTEKPVCKAFIQGHCPLGHSCPDKHPAQSSFNSLVCKHWMRALCKKGEQCEFLHEYNLRRMPECHTFARHGTCPNGDDCMYQHLDSFSRRPACPHYERGFCPLGPICANKHIRKAKICPFYLAGFCPDGRECTQGAHARFPTELKKPTVRGQEPTVDPDVDGFNVDHDPRQDNDSFDRSDRQFGGQTRGFSKKPWRGSNNNNNKRGGGFKPRGRG